MTLKSIFETSKDTIRRINSVSVGSRLAQQNRVVACTIKVNPDKKFQTFKGFGCALTESSGYVLSRLPAAIREQAVKSCFDKSAENSNGYTIARTHMNSCDFSLENWACVPEKDETLQSFSMERTNLYITPLLKSANSCGGGISILVSPWSPPAWMKTNNDMNHGGKLLPEYKKLWAEYYAVFIGKLHEQGLRVDYLTVQNEPAAIQPWDSCEWSGTEEAEFAVNYLKGALKNAGLDNVKILVWDHNRDLLLERMKESMSVKNADNVIDGAAYHWYSGDQYDNVKKCSELFPSKELFFTEGCVEGGARADAWFTGERYAHNIINDLNSGCTAWIDWNMILDMKGGPNHVNNFCDAPILANFDEGTIHYQSSYYYIGHFSRFIKPGAVRLDNDVEGYMVPATIDGKLGNYVECTAFQNPDKTIAVVITNRTEADAVYKLKIGSHATDKTTEKVYSCLVDENKDCTFFTCPPRSIQTLIFGE